MLYYQTIEPDTLELLKNLMKKDYLNQFVLVGGTALALQLGHRKSIDIDLFTINDFDTNILAPHLIENYEITTSLQLPQTLICSINSIKVDFIRFKYPFIRPFKVIDEIRMLDIEDIAPMKLDAVAGRGRKKDFYDIYFLLQKLSLKELLELYLEKYQNQTTFHVLRSLLYFNDAEQDPDPIVIDSTITWGKVKKQIIKEVKNLS